MQINDRVGEANRISVLLARARAPFAGNMGNLLFGGLIVFIALIILLRAIPSGFSFLLQIFVFGLGQGSILALVALGYTMVYGIIELINFAHGDVVTLGSFLGLTLIGSFGLTEGQALGFVGVVELFLVYLIVMVALGFVNVGIERVAYRPLRNAPRLAPLITAVGMSFVLEGLMFLWKGATFIHFPDLLPDRRIPIGGASISTKDLFVIAISGVLVVALNEFISRAKLGKAMRATAQDRDAAQLMGIDINRTIAATFFIGAVLAAAGGITRGLYFNSINFQDGYQLGLFAFTAAVFGGIGNIQGAALGGLFIGMVLSFGDAYFSTTWTDVYIFGILILVLVFRPTGLLGMRVPEK